jgi:transposase-like protein
MVVCRARAGEAVGAVGVRVTGPAARVLSTFIQTLMSAEADAVCGSPYRSSSPDRTNVRNGYRHRDFDTRTGTIDVGIPKLRSGSYFPDWCWSAGAVRRPR